MLATSPLTLHHHRLFYEGLNQVQIYQPGPGGRKLHSQIELMGSDCDLVLLQWLDCRCVQWLAVDESGRIFLGATNTGVKQTINPFITLDVRHIKDASVVGSQIWLSLTDNETRGGLKLVGLELSSGELTYEHMLPKGLEGGTMVPVDDGDFVFYRRQSGKQGQLEHDLVRFSTSTDTVHEFSLPGTPAPDELSCRDTFFMHKAHGCALMVDASSAARHIDATQGTDTYLQQVILADFRRPELSWCQPVRTLSLAQMETDDDDAEELKASLDELAAGEVKRSLHHAMQKFAECLTSCITIDDGNKLWLGWQDDKVLCVGRDGASRSPLYQLARDAEGKPLHWDELEVLSLLDANDNSLLVAKGELEFAPRWRVTLPSQVKPHSMSESALLIADKASAQLEVPAALMLPSASGQLDLACEDLQDYACVLACLNKALEMMPTLQQHYEAMSAEQLAATGFQLAFYNPDGGKYSCDSEYDVLPKGYADEAVEVAIAKLVEAVSGWSFAGKLSGYKGQPVLADGVMVLSQKAEYLPLLARYFNAIKTDGCVHPYHIRNTLPVIRERHAGSQALATFLAAIPYPFNDELFTLPDPDDYDNW